ncbi:hypothetical protein LEP1GSC187_3376 [Leptospira santarosai str. ZUN179]|uniref:Uncharacterized protein n=1 Tax=Leptospira santarosai str. ZUN179 TaxID=1049985 RepID=M6UG38_9LEPT|nr:hypothetical protein LEP1GSC187_3376 [Leptospira santarosai str. ZUN179]
MGTPANLPNDYRTISNILLSFLKISVPIILQSLSQNLMRNL